VAGWLAGWVGGWLAVTLRLVSFKKIPGQASKSNNLLQEIPSLKKYKNKILLTTSLNWQQNSFNFPYIPKW